MENEFAYISKEPFKDIENNSQEKAIISTVGNELEIKTFGTNNFSAFNDENSRTLYAFDRKSQPISAYNIFVSSTNYSAIPNSVLRSNLYFINQTKIDNRLFRHFTLNTKIRELSYYNDSSKQVFINKALSLKSKTNPNHYLKEVSIKGKYVKDTLLGEIDTGKNVIKVFLSNAFKYNQQCSGEYTITVNDRSHIVMKCKKGIEFEEAYRYIRVLDTVFYLMTFMKRRHHEIYLKDYSKQSYYCCDRLADIDHKKVKDRNFLLCNRVDAADYFIKLFENVLKIETDAKNALFPVLNYDYKPQSVETAFLEYYKSLEYIHLKEQEKQGKGKNPTFVLGLLKRYPELKQRLFGNQDEKEIEQEIRSLRNYYSHTGFYVEKLPIYEKKVLIRQKPVEPAWLYDVLKFVKVATHLEIYRLCGFDINSNYIYNEI